MIASIFLLFVAAGIIVGSVIVGFGGFGVIIVGLAGLSFIAACVALLYISQRQTG